MITWEQTVDRTVQAVMSCWLEDCKDVSATPDLDYTALDMLYHHIKTAIIQQRTEYHE